MINTAEPYLEVYLRRVQRNSRYKEYNLRDDVPPFRTAHRFCYVEAKAHEQFVVIIKVLPGFNYFTAPGMQVRFWLDNHDEPDVYYYTKITGFHTNGNEYVLSDYLVKVGDEWQNGQLAFGDLNVDENSDRVLSRGLRGRMGTIRVSIQRGFEEQDEDYNIYERVEGHELPAVGKHDIKHGGISHMVKPVNPQVVKQPDFAKHFRGLIGRNGDQYVYEFRYRSREELQRIGINMDDNAPNTVVAQQRAQTHTPGLFMTPPPPRPPPAPPFRGGFLNALLPYQPPSPPAAVPAQSPRTVIKRERETSPDSPGPVPPASRQRRMQAIQPAPASPSTAASQAATSGTSARRPLFGNRLSGQPSPAPTDATESHAGPSNTMALTAFQRTSSSIVDVEELDEEELRLQLRRGEIARRKLELERQQLEMEERQFEMEARLRKLRKQSGGLSSQADSA